MVRPFKPLFYLSGDIVYLLLVGFNLHQTQ